jgi:hypothetical protein
MVARSGTKFLSSLLAKLNIIFDKWYNLNPLEEKPLRRGGFKATKIEENFVG